ncbi:MAG: DNA helicase RecQ [Flavobacteriales bacterium]|nr:DNA helicase RecQ [Flavobacteriales bacterium]
MSKTLLELLETKFGYNEFRPQQEEIINRILKKKDALVLMPTGGGKSICFQLPALVFDGLTVVISPLISLMKDQVEALKANGINAEFFNSSLTQTQEKDIVEDVIAKKIKLLYLSPERLFQAYDGWLKKVEISLVAIDESHCVSMWGHDFRPEYTQLNTLRSKLKEVPFVALTATADKTTRKDIISQIGLINPKTFITSFDRPNLSLNVRYNVRKKDKMNEIIALIKQRKNESGIIYCLSRKNVDQLTKELQNFGVNVESYHAGLSRDKRIQVQEDFIMDKVPIICATIAFGMGIDKSNVRWVIHNNLPKNIEGYYQEIGRAGRDGMPSDTILYYNLRDLMVLKQFVDQSELKEVYTEKLNRMLHYSEALSCRRQILLSYFGEQLAEKCGNCDVCKNPPRFFDGTILAQKAVSGVLRLNEKVGTNMLINVLRGSLNQEILSRGFDQIKTYGAGADLSFRDWQQYIIQLINIGVLEIAYDESFTLKVTAYGKDIVEGKRKIDLTYPKVKEVKPAKEKRAKKVTGSSNELLFEELRQMRQRLAVQNKVPAYVIFHDSTLHDMVNTMPTTSADFLAVQGVSDNKLHRFGKYFMQVIIEYPRS